MPDGNDRATAAEADRPAVACSDWLAGIKASSLAFWWRSIEPLVARAIERTPYWTVESVRRSIEAEDRQLWLVAPHRRSILITEIVNYPTGQRRLQLFAYAGVLDNDWPVLLALLEGWAAEQGFAGVDLVGRPGWQRIMAAVGYRLTAVMMAKEL